jgi:DNA replication protein DnaC
MPDHPTLDHLKALRLDGMAEAFAELQVQDAAADLSHAEWLGLLVDREVVSRETKRFEARMRSARLRHVGAWPEDVDYRAPCGLDKALFQSLLTGKWIADRRNLIVTGPLAASERPGSAAPWRKRPAVRASPWFANGCPASSKSLHRPLATGACPRVFRSITKAQLLILDDWGPDRLTVTRRRDLMEIVEERYGRGSTMITSQLPIKAWHDVIGEPTFADAIPDRIVHNAYRIELEGASMRKTIGKMDDDTPQI